MTAQTRLEKFSSLPIEEKLAALREMSLSDLQDLKSRREMDLETLYARWGTKAAKSEDAVGQMVIEDDLSWIAQRLQAKKKAA